MNKFDLVRRVIQNCDWHFDFKPRLLDVGCRGCELHTYVSEMVSYEGVDLFQNSDKSVTHVLDVSKGLPFADRSFDYVIGLDILEHLDNFQESIEELLRVSGDRLIVMLPNMAHLLFRFKFLRTGRLSGKYDFIFGQGQDRHRWLTILSQSDDYMRRFCSSNDLDLQIIWFNDSAKKRLFAKLAQVLRLSPDCYIWSSLYVINRRNAI
jgi:hypothetical protein